jgi:hypothetical protein
VEPLEREYVMKSLLLVTLLLLTACATSDKYAGLSPKLASACTQYDLLILTAADLAVGRPALGPKVDQAKAVLEPICHGAPITDDPLVLEAKALAALVNLINEIYPPNPQVVK